MAEIGEGGISHGPMVPIFEGRDPLAADRALERLDAAGIPALRADQVPGAFLGPVPRGVILIVVPLGLLAQARSTLLQTDLPPLTTPEPAPRSPLDLTKTSVGSAPTAPDSAAGSVKMSVGSQRLEVRPTSRVPMPVRSSVSLDDDDEGPLEVPPFESMGVQTRLILALGACTVGALTQASLLVTGSFQRIVRYLALSWDGVAFHGNVVMAGFVHGSPVHFLGNLAFGLLLGTVLIGTHGLGATAAVWLAASMAGIAAEAALSPGVSVLGASAGIYGLVGLWLRGELQRARRSVLPRRAVIRAFGVIVLLAPGAMTPFTSSGSRVAVLAHLVGFAVGLLAGVIFPRWLSDSDRLASGRRGGIAFAVSVAVTMAGMVTAFLAVQGQTF